VTEDSFVALEAAVQTAEDHWRAGNLAAAFDLYREIVSKRLLSPRVGATLWMAADIVIIERLVDLSALFGQFEAADALLAGMVVLNEQAMNSYGVDYMLLKRVHLTLEHGLLGPASQLLESSTSKLNSITMIDFDLASLQRWESEQRWPNTSATDPQVLFSRLYLVMGRLLASLGQYDNAITVLERGLHHTGAHASSLARQAFVPLQLSRIAAMLEWGNLAVADRELQNLRSALDEVQQLGFYVRWLELSSKWCFLRGELGRAREQCERIFSICQGRGFQQAGVRAALNLAQVMIFLNQTSAAQTLLQNVQEEMHQLNDGVALARATLLLSLADVRARSLADGIQLAPSVSEMRAAHRDPQVRERGREPAYPKDLPQSANYLTLFEDRSLEFQWRLSRYELEPAAQWLSNIKDVFETTDSTLIHIRIHVLAGLLAYYEGDLENAEAMLIEARPVLSSLGMLPDLWQVQRVLGWCWERLGRPKTEQLVLAETTEALLSQMTASLPAADQDTFLLNKWTTDERYIGAEIHRLVDLKKQVHVRSGLRRLRLWWLLMKRIHALQTHIDRYKGVLADRAFKEQGATQEALQHRVVPLWRRLLTHPRKRVTFSYTVLPGQVFIVQAGWLSLDFGVSPFSRVQVRESVRQWHQLCQRSGTARHLTGLAGQKETRDTKDEQNELASYLASALQIPTALRALSPRISSLSIVPDDSLHGFPFAAIVHEKKYLVERFALSTSYLSSTSHDRGRSSDKKIALLVSVPQGGHGVSPLPGSQAELDRIAPWLQRSRLIPDRREGTTATKAEILRQLPHARFFHIACHGTFVRNQPDQSGMVLMPHPDHMEILSLRDLSQLNLVGLQLATLSSCWSADNFVLPGRWIISLPEILWRAGAQSILGSLWQVDDRVAPSFMERFHDYLNSLPLDEALQRTQLDCLQGNLSDCDGLDTTAPAHWAAFNVYGTPGPVRL
jgi:CHAT domain-containing protein